MAPYGDIASSPEEQWAFSAPLTRNLVLQKFLPRADTAVKDGEAVTLDEVLRRALSLLDVKRIVQTAAELDPLGIGIGRKTGSVLAAADFTDALRHALHRVLPTNASVRAQVTQSDGTIDYFVDGRFRFGIECLKNGTAKTRQVPPLPVFLCCGCSACSLTVYYCRLGARGVRRGILTAAKDSTNR